MRIDFTSLSIKRFHYATSVEAILSNYISIVLFIFVYCIHFDIITQLDGGVLQQMLIIVAMLMHAR